MKKNLNFFNFFFFGQLRNNKFLTLEKKFKSVKRKESSVFSSVK